MTGLTFDKKLLIRQVCFAFVAIFVELTFPVPSLERPNAHLWINTEMNKFSAQVVAMSYDSLAKPDRGTDNVQVVNRAVVRFRSGTINGRPVYRALNFNFDNLFALGLRALLLFLLYVLIIPPRTVPYGLRCRAIGLAFLWFVSVFIIRATVLGWIAHVADVIAVVRWGDDPFRLFALVMPIVLGAREFEEEKSLTKSLKRWVSNHRSICLAVAASCVIAGCKGSIANNNINITIGGGNGGTVPCIIMLMVMGWLQFRGSKRKEGIGDSGLGNGNQVKAEGEGERRTDKVFDCGVGSTRSRASNTEEGIGDSGLGIRRGEGEAGLCGSAEELIRKLVKRDEDAEAAHLERIGKLFVRNWIYPKGAEARKAGSPRGADYFETMAEILEDGIRSIEDGKVSAPLSCSAWQLVLPDILTFPADAVEYYEVPEGDDDPACREFVLSDGTRATIGWSLRPHPLEAALVRVRDLTLKYLMAGFRYAQRVNSKSSEKWAEALGCYNRINCAFRMPQSKPLLERMAQAMIDALTRLQVDINYGAPSANPVPAYITGVSKEGGEALRGELKDKGGPTPKPQGGARKLTQKDVADMFGSPCNAEMVGNWESYGKAGVKRGSVPPCANYKGALYSYTRDLRANPTQENMEILCAIAKAFRSTAGVKDGIRKFVHPRSDESLYRAKGR